MKIQFYIGFLNYQIKASSQQNTAHRKWKSFLICQLIGRLNDESIFRLSSNICNCLKYKGKAGEEAGEACMGEVIKITGVLKSFIQLST